MPQMTTLEEVLTALKKENQHSNEKHGDWTDFPELKQDVAIAREIREWIRARKAGDIHGQHGEIAEALQVMNVMAKRIMYLSKNTEVPSNAR